MTTVNVEHEEVVESKVIVLDTRYRRAPKDPFPDLPPVIPRINYQTFTQKEVAKIFNDITPSIISYDCKALGLRGEDLGLEEVWQIYVLRAWMRLHEFRRHRDSYIKELKEHEGDEDGGDRYILTKIAAIGANRKHFESLIKNYLATVKTSKLI